MAISLSSIKSAISSAVSKASSLAGRAVATVGSAITPKAIAPTTVYGPQQTSTGLPTGTSFNVPASQAVKQGTALSTSGLQKAVSSGYLTPISSSSYGTVSLPSSAITSGVASGYLSAPAYSPLGAPVSTSTLSSNQSPVNIPVYAPSVSKLQTTAPELAASVGVTEKLQKLEQEKLNLESELQKELDLQKKFIPEMPQMPDVTSQYEEAYKRDVLPYKQEEQRLKSQIEAINAETQANKLSLVGQGRGIPEVIIGGQQAQLEREATIKLLPLTAQLASAQGNVQLAQEHVDRYFDMVKEDVTNQYKYKLAVYNSLKDTLTKAEERQFKAKEAEMNKNYKIQSENREFAREIAKTAMSNGQTGLFSQITNLVNTGQIDTPQGIARFNALTSQIAPKTSSGGALSTLPTSTANKVLSMANNFGSTDIVKKFNATADAINIVNSIDPKSKNPADHQTIVYSFAKSLDPDSVVREGEYATIKKYAQSVVDNYRKEITNAINGTGFLSERAISNIKSTMNNNYIARKPAYDNLSAQTKNIINNVAGKDVADELVIDYSSGVTDIATTELDNILNSGTVSTYSNPTGFFNSFLNMFGLTTK